MSLYVTEMTAELSGILGLSFPKMQFQLSTLHLLESLQGSSSSGKSQESMKAPQFIYAIIAYRGIVADFSYELLRIGKVEHSINVLSPFMVHLEESTLDLPTSLLYLNYAEALASSGDLSRRHVPKLYTILAAKCVFLALLCMKVSHSTLLICIRMRKSVLPPREYSNALEVSSCHR